MSKQKHPIEMIPGLNISTQYKNQEDVILDIEHHNLIDAILGTIKNPRNAEMFKKYWYEGYTLRELAKRYNVNHERARQILISVFKKLR